MTVNSVAGLTAALKTATAGETIALAAGNYSGVALNGVHFNQAVTITSADPTHEAVLVGLKVTGSSGLAFNDIGMTTVGSTDPYYAFRVSSSQNISFNDVNAYGASTVAPGSQLTGFYISGSNGVSITNSTIHDMNGGIDASQDQNLTFSNNSFYALSKGGIGISADNNVVASGNTFTNFTVANGTHSDAIQVFTAGTTVGSSNVTITDNTMTRGTGNAFQGVFVKDETGVTPYSNLTITNNTVIGGMWNSIYVNAAVTGVLNVSNNMAASWAGIDVSSAAAGATTYPTANFLGSVELTGNFSGAQLTEVGNVAQGYITNQISGVAPTGNTMIGAIAPVTNLAQLQTMVTAVAAQSAVVEHGTVAGNVLTGATGGTLDIADIGVGTGAQHAVGSGGATVWGAYGTLTINPDGSYNYVETKSGLVAGQAYDEHFSTTIANVSGQATASTLDVIVSGSAVGDGGKDMIYGGAGAQTFSGFGAGSYLVSGSGPDTFQFDKLAQATPTNQTTIQQFKAGDTIDLSHVDPLFHLVSKWNGTPDELSIQQVSAGNWEVYGNTTGAGTNFQIHVTGTAGALIADSFHL